MKITLKTATPCNMVLVRLGKEARVKGLPNIIVPLARKP